jgi:hypothetical protein
MTHDEKIEYLLNDLGQRGIGKYTVAPPLYRLLWRLGVKVAPPHFAGFWPLTAFMGTFFGLAWGAFMWLLLWRAQEMPVTIAIGTAAVAGLCFGLAMACYYRWRWRKLALPRWQDYPGDHAHAAG